MIIFDLDNVLANCEHRKHFIDLDKMYPSRMGLEYADGRKWKPDYESYDSACESDEPIQPVIRILKEFQVTYPECENIQIWTGRSESTRIHTHVWLMKYAGFEPCRDTVKMRPIGNNEPVSDLKNSWANELASIDVNQDPPKIIIHDSIEMVFDSDPDSIDMWKSRGIFVFDCRQGRE